MVLVELTGNILIATPTKSSLSGASLTVMNDDAARQGAWSFRSMTSCSTPSKNRRSGGSS